MVLATASGSRGLRGGELEPLTDQLAGVEVDDGALDTASAHVDAESAALRDPIRARLGGGGIGGGHERSSAEAGKYDALHTLVALECFGVAAGQPAGDNLCCDEAVTRA